MNLRRIALLLESETWQEGDHPRDGDGKFSTGSAGSVAIGGTPSGLQQAIDKIKPNIATVKKAPSPKPKTKTYDVAKKDIMDHLSKNGWKLSKPGLKIPHATSPDGKVRLWFKSQAVYSSGGLNINDFGSARTLAYDLDIRKVDPDKFMKWAYDRENAK